MESKLFELRDYYMQKYIYAGIILAIVVSVASAINYSYPQKKEVIDIDKTDIKTLIGTVRPIGVSIYMQGTHFLFGDDGKIETLLESKTINLKDFNDKKVEVSGLTRKTVEGDQQIMTVVKIELVSH